ncbi:MAG: hypothetical protein AB1898_32875 [Acidobacteriota bacterium]
MAKLITETCLSIIGESGELALEDLRKLSELLSNRGRAGSGDSNLPENLTIRDVALTVLEELAEGISPISASKDERWWPTKCIISYWDEAAGHPVRYTIPDLSEVEFQRIQEIMPYWLGGCETFLSFRSRRAKGVSHSLTAPNLPLHLAAEPN